MKIPVALCDCPICEHAYERRETSLHHLVPKSRKGKETLRLCRGCHKQIHALFTEKELAREYNTVEKLLGSEELRRWAEWMKRRKPTANIRARGSQRKNAARRDWKRDRDR